MLRAFFILMCCATAALAAPVHEVTQAQIVAEQAYDDAKSHYQTNSSDAKAAWQFARTCFDLADLSTKNSERAGYGREGIDAARAALKLEPKSAAAHYYLGMNIGQVAQTKTLGALSLVRQMESEWSMARDLDARVDYAGPDRNLGMLYRDAPGPPLSIGDRVSAVQHLMRAVELSPEYPENHLNLIESQIKWNQMSEADREYKKFLKTLPDARKLLTGPKWQGPWHDWDERQKAIETKLNRWRKHASSQR
jgi:tetratricopeptide (TPR) repeat protein